MAEMQCSKYFLFMKFINNLLHHQFRFRFTGNIKVLACRIFGHRIANKPNHACCERCGLAYEEIYTKYGNYYDIIRKEYCSISSYKEEINEEIDIFGVDGTYYDTFSVKVFLSDILYPQVFLIGKTKDKYGNIPSVSATGFCGVSIPINCQQNFLEFDKDWTTYKKETLIPYLANLIFYSIEGRFLNGGWSAGSEGFSEYLQENQN